MPQLLLVPSEVLSFMKFKLVSYFPPLWTKNSRLENMRIFKFYFFEQKRIKLWNYSHFI
jgi:hypothetical protein